MSTAARIPTGPGPVVLPLSAIFKNDIQTLLTANTVSIPEQEDPFDAAFDNTFASNVTATINGKNESRDELKKFLLGIRDALNNESVDFTSVIEHQDDDNSEENGEVGALFTWEGFRPFLVFGAPQAVKAQVSVNASFRVQGSANVPLPGLRARKITNVSVVSQEIPVPIVPPTAGNA